VIVDSVLEWLTKFEQIEPIHHVRFAVQASEFDLFEVGLLLLLLLDFDQILFF